MCQRMIICILSMDIFDVIILGIIEGITEFLPISSTAHLILAGKMLGISQNDFSKSFEIAIQSGAIASVLILCWRVFILRWDVVKRIVAAFLPTALVGLLLYPFIRGVLMDGYTIPLLALFLGGIALVAFELWYKEKPHVGDDIGKITYSNAWFISVICHYPGCFTCCRDNYRRACCEITAQNSS